MAKEFKYVGRSKGGVPRVFGVGPTPDVAETECLRAVREYVRRRPDTGPVVDWTISNEDQIPGVL